MCLFFCFYFCVVAVSDFFACLTFYRTITFHPLNRCRLCHTPLSVFIIKADVKLLQLEIYLSFIIIMLCTKYIYMIVYGMKCATLGQQPSTKPSQINFTFLCVRANSFPSSSYIIQCAENKKIGMWRTVCMHIIHSVWLNLRTLIASLCEMS